MRGLKRFWRDNRFTIIFVVVAVIALLCAIFIGIPYYINCAEAGGFIVSGKSGLCWTPDGPKWPWQLS